MRFNPANCVPLLTLLLAPTAWTAEPALNLTVDVNQPGVAVSPVMHGLFFEDINYGADGGLYAELVQNRSFEHKEHLYAWTTVKRGSEGEVKIATEAPLNSKNPTYLRVQVNTPGQGLGVANSGYDGIAVRSGENYRFSVHARRDEPYKGDLRAILENEDGRVLGQCNVAGLSPHWQRLTGVIRSSGTTDKARLVVVATGTGRVDLDVISLFPQNTWKQRPNGLRADLVQMLAQMRPGFMRFPGGCIVEGKTLANAYRWKDTIGDVAERPQNWNRWMEWNAPQYYQTYGLGFYEYFQLCEDIGAEPVPIINCGMACQFQSGELVPLHELGPWVQDALDLIEFANGPVTSVWGARRAAMGHPRPFNMKYLGIGNEQWGEAYFERYKIFYAAIKRKYPHIQLVTTSGPGVDDNWWNLAWGKFKSGTPAEIVDEHYYRAPRWFLENSQRYDQYDPKGPRVFAGEFAAHDTGRRNNLRSALAEAAFMTGLVRNADVIHMASYAPLFAKVGSTQWQPDLIWFNNDRVYGSPSYYVQAMYSRHRADVTVPAVVSGAGQQAATFPGRIGVSTWNTQAEFKDIQVTKNGETLFRSDFSRGLAGWQTPRGQWQVVDGALRQNLEQTDMQALAGDPTWTDYTLTLKARKLSGREGFLILFQAAGDGTTSVWNLGGWDNTFHGLDVPGQGQQRIPGKIEPGRWYDIRIELKGPSIKGYLDGQLIQQATRKALPSLYTVAGRDLKAGETILKVVNPTARAMQANINVRGVRRVEPWATSIVLTAGSPEDENSLQAPAKVIPRQATVRIAGANFAHSFPAYSFTILRLKTR